MYKMKKEIVFVFVLILVCGLLLAFVPSPHAFYGSVNYNNAGIANGCSILTKLDGVDNAQCSIIGGRYGYDTNTCIVVNEETSGKVEFYLEGVKIGEHEFIDKEVTKLDFAIDFVPACSQASSSSSSSSSSTSSGGGGGSSSSSSSSSSSGSGQDEGFVSLGIEEPNEMEEEKDEEKTQEGVGGGITGGVVGFVKTETGRGLILGIIIGILLVVMLGMRKKQPELVDKELIKKQLKNAKK